MDQSPAICFACARLWPSPDQDSGAQLVKFCDAFPGGIPPQIASGAFDHRKKFGGERDGLLFKQAEGAYAQVQFDTWDKYHQLQGNKED